MARIRAHRNNRYATTFNKSLVALTILSALHGANAQEQDDQENTVSSEEEVVEKIEVKGIRGNLLNA